MDEATLVRLMMTRGYDFPPVVNALSKLSDDHPLKVQATEMAVRLAEADPVVTVEDRLAEVEARLTLLGGADDSVHQS